MKDRSAASDFAPAVSILKPVKGLDAQAYRNFASFCQQDYPHFELLFGVSDPEDPVIPVIQRLQHDFPERTIRLLVAPATHANRKASLLHSLVAHAQYGTLVASDSDMRVGPDYLRRVVAPLVDENVGLVTCLYRGRNPVTLTARLEALHMGVTFLPSVLVARRVLNMRFAMGATVALRRSDLARMGGFASVASYLADDYQLGVQIADLGLRVHLSDYIVDSILGPTTFREQWDREVRWAQCSRVSRPAEYPGMLLTFCTPLALILALVAGFDALTSAVLAASLLFRWLVGWWVTAYTDNRATRRWLIWLPLRDALSALVWCVGAVGRYVVWRGEKYVLQPGGRLKPLDSLARSRGIDLTVLPQGFVRGIDAVLRRLYGIREFCHHQDCMLRLSISHSKEDIVLSDGTHIRRGDEIGELHLWNELVPSIPQEGANLAWARAFQRRLAFSLSRLAAYVQRELEYRDIQAFRGANTFLSPYKHMRRIVGRWGFEVVGVDGSSGLFYRFGQFWAGLYAWALAWAFNPVSVKDDGLWVLQPSQLWMSRETLLEKYGSAGEADVDGDLQQAPAQEIGMPPQPDGHSK
jgi:ceramide glucosyltransferase